MIENHQVNLFNSKYNPTKGILQFTVFFDHPVSLLLLEIVPFPILSLLLLEMLLTYGTPHAGLGVRQFDTAQWKAFLSTNEGNVTDLCFKL